MPREQSREANPRLSRHTSRDLLGPSAEVQGESQQRMLRSCVQTWTRSSRDFQSEDNLKSEIHLLSGGSGTYRSQ